MEWVRQVSRQGAKVISDLKLQISKTSSQGAGKLQKPPRKDAEDAKGISNLRLEISKILMPRRKDVKDIGGDVVAQTCNPL
ncbi:MAG TPA: hypothetical protein VNO70_15930 [Blastocatellia bacterium]|nr:hypothetical protein [Blastocatellia bacterium]